MSLECEQCHLIDTLACVGRHIASKFPEKDTTNLLTFALIKEKKALKLRYT